MVMVKDIVTYLFVMSKFVCVTDLVSTVSRVCNI
jgi:hypothetical protein